MALTEVDAARARIAKKKVRTMVVQGTAHNRTFNVVLISPGAHDVQEAMYFNTNDDL